MGSEVVIAVGADGRLVGEYCGAKGALAGQPYPLVGQCQMRTNAEVIPVAFVVDWSEARGVTAWCGRYVAAPVEEIRVTWLMSSETEPADEWKATLVGHDVFHRA